MKLGNSRAGYLKPFCAGMRLQNHLDPWKEALAAGNCPLMDGPVEFKPEFSCT